MEGLFDNVGVQPQKSRATFDAARVARVGLGCFHPVREACCRRDADPMTWGYVGRRCGMFLLVVWIGLSMNFLLPRLATPEISRPRCDTGSPFLLDRPLWEQYTGYLSNLAHLDLNYSMSSYPSRVADQIEYALPWTVALLGTTSLLAWAIGTLVGAALALPSRSHLAQYLFPPLMMLSAAPYFITGMLLLYMLAFHWRLFPLGGGYEAGTFPEFSAGFVLMLVQHATLPALSIILASIATWSISMRSLIVSLRGEDFMLLAEAKGLRRPTIFLRYVIRNALLPQVTALGIALGQIASGGLLVEAVFRYPGLGGLLLHAILTKDYFLEQGIVLIIIVSIAFVTLVLDLAYPLLDPRLKTVGRVP
ncbi:MAG: ABC transporter permease [Chloroflexota bacterium]